jgi:PAS domain S-box-containing protein
MPRFNGYLLKEVNLSNVLTPLRRVIRMADTDRMPLLDLDEDAALRTILEGTATETGERFFYALVENLAKALNTHGAMVTRYRPEQRQLQAYAFWMDGKWLRDFVFDIPGTPCEQVINHRRLVHFPDRLLDLFPGNKLRDFGLVSYLGMPLEDVDGAILGHMAVVDRRPMPEAPRVLAIFRIFATRAAAELQRLKREVEIREREEKLGRLVDSAMDAIIELDQTFQVTRMNAAAEKAFRCTTPQVVGQGFGQLLAQESCAKLTNLIQQLDARPEGKRYLWIAGGLIARPADGSPFQAEATLSQFEMHGQRFCTLILRNVNDRLEAERKIQTLTVQTEYLQEEIKELYNSDEILGRSQSLAAVLQDVRQVAPTSATVLILGETGVGKELLARAIHSASPRRDRPLIKVNCAAIPANLIESEFFGHEKGAFTGATRKREGRFSLADGSTIFLDEVGELPLDLQAKLLRVLQEGEFEPVGSSQTRRVDLRVIAATNRDLKKLIKTGEFRNDLYYRLNVFPITVPPLRERKDDIALLASAFAARYSARMGRAINPLSEASVRRLKAYDWPGNVRELENIIERAVITSRDGNINLDRALPELSSTAVIGDEARPEEAAKIRTAQELREQERANIILALESTGWRVAGESGAAQLLGINPSTLNSRIRALGIERRR